jgi:hypothetical protein
VWGERRKRTKSNEQWNKRGPVVQGGSGVHVRRSQTRDDVGKAAAR